LEFKANKGRRNVLQKKTKKRHRSLNRKERKGHKDLSFNLLANYQSAKPVGRESSRAVPAYQVLRTLGVSAISAISAVD
jgi:hypothetical protein